MQIGELSDQHRAHAGSFSAVRSRYGRISASASCCACAAAASGLARAVKHRLHLILHRLADGDRLEGSEPAAPRLVQLRQRHRRRRGLRHVHLHLRQVVGGAVGREIAGEAGPLAGDFRAGQPLDQRPRGLLALWRVAGRDNQAAAADRGGIEHVARDVGDLEGLLHTLLHVAKRTRREQHHSRAPGEERGRAAVRVQHARRHDLVLMHEVIDEAAVSRPSQGSV